MRSFDAIVIGGGVLGCFAARELRRFEISTLLIEAEEDVCAGVTRANSAIVYPGYDNRPGTLKAKMCVEANRGFEALCGELETEFSRCGSLMVCFEEKGAKSLERKLRQGLESGVTGLELISGGEARALEPMLSEGVVSALYSPDTGTVNPWWLGIAAYENAVRNGCEAALGQRVLSIARDKGGYVIETERDSFFCRFVINCAGLCADRVQELLFAPSVRLFPDGADFLVLDSGIEKPGRVIFCEDEGGKGITAVPCVSGELLLGPTQRPLGQLWATSPKGLETLRSGAARLLPGLEMGAPLRSFGSVRPNPHRVVFRDGQYLPDGTSIGSFVIDSPAPDFLSFIGIKTPGLTCARELGAYGAKRAAELLSAAPNPDFDPRRKAISRRDGHIVCRCQGVSRAEIIEAIDRGAVSAEGVKRRVGTGMGLCQGGRCAAEIERLLKEQAKKHGTL